MHKAVTWSYHKQDCYLPTRFQICVVPLPAWPQGTHRVLQLVSVHWDAPHKLHMCTTPYSNPERHLSRVAANSYIKPCTEHNNLINMWHTGLVPTDKCLVANLILFIWYKFRM